MGQAKAAQEKVAYLKSQRQDASAKGDTEKQLNTMNKSQERKQI